MQPECLSSLLHVSFKLLLIQNPVAEVAITQREHLKHFPLNHVAVHKFNNTHFQHRAALIKLRFQILKFVAANFTSQAAQ